MAVLPVMNPGVQLDILTESPGSAGMDQRDLVIQSDAVLATVSVYSIAGTIDVVVYAVVDGRELPILTFPTISSPTDLVIQVSAATTSQLRVRATYTAAVSYRVQCRAVGSGSSVVIQGTVPWIVDGSGVTQPISAVSLPLPAGASTEAKQDSEIVQLVAIATDTSSIDTHAASIDASTSSIDGKLTTTVNGLRTDVIASALPTGAATAANQVTANTTLSTISTTASSIDTSANAIEASVASIDGKLTTTANGLRTDVIASALPAGASTSALQTTANTSLSAIASSTASIDGKLNSLGQKTMSGSVPVTLASDQTDIHVGHVTGPVALPTGAATAANQVTANTSLSSIDTHTTSIDSKLTTTANGTRVDVIATVGPSYTYFHPRFSLRVQAVTGASGALSTTLNVNIASSTATNLIAVAVGSSVAGTVTVTDNLSQVYTTAVSGTSGTHTNYMFYKANSAAGVTQINISSTVGSGLSAVVTEYSGITASPLDKTSTGTVVGVTAFSSGATAATTTATELLLGSAYGTTKNNSTYTAGTGWTTVGLINGFNAAAGQLYVEDQYVQATGTYTATGTASANDTIVSDIATFAFSSAALTIVGSPKVLKTGAGVFSSLTINTVGTGAATATLYDGTSTAGTVIAVVSLTNFPFTFTYNAIFTTGLTLVLNSTTADITVMYA